MRQTLKGALPLAMLLAVMASAIVAGQSAENAAREPVYLNYDGKITSVARSPETASFKVLLAARQVEADEVSSMEDNEEARREEVEYHVYGDTPLFSLLTMSPMHSDEIMVGQRIIAAYKMTTPVLLSLPPQINPEVVIVDDADGGRFAKVDHFDTNGLSSDGGLQLNLSGETPITDLEGNELSSAEALNKNLIVFYTITTRSLPPQTSPEKVVCLEQVQREQGPATQEETPSAQEQAKQPQQDQSLTANDVLAALTVYDMDGARVVKLRDMAELLGYGVAWDGETRQVTLTKGQRHFQLTIDSPEYTADGLKFVLGKAPFIVSDYTYVEERFADSLM